MKTHQFEFTRNTKEYFGIWVVNLFLSIVTIGIYSAWAKVRRTRYFYANTYLDGHNFEYHAKPTSILLGRMIVVGALLAINLLISVQPIMAFLLVPSTFALPWMINRGLRFRARVTSYRSVRFDFVGNYRKALFVFIIMPALAVLTLGVLWPLVSRATANYLGNNLRYGTSEFSTNAQLSSLYKNFGTSIAFFSLASIVFGSIAAVIAFSSGGFEITDMMMETGDMGAGPGQIFGANPIWLVGSYLAASLGYFFYNVGVRNVAFNATSLGDDHQLHSSISRLKYAWIMLSNLIVSLLTLGLMRPWSALRTWRYRISQTSLESEGDMGLFIDHRVEEGIAVSSEYMDIGGIDFFF